MKQFVVIGMGRFGSSLATTLYSLGNDVLVIDKDFSRMESVANQVTHAAQADATDESALKALGISNFEVAVVATGDIQASILICLLCKELGVQTVVAKAKSELHAKALRKVGVDRIVLPERDMGMRLAHSLVSSTILDYIELSPDYSVVELSTPLSWVGKTLVELNVRSTYGVNVLAIKRGEQIIVSPHRDERIASDDALVMVGTNADINAIERRSL